MAKKKSLPVYALAFCLFLGGVGYMVWAGLSENSVYFLNVSEALAMPGQELKAARLFGTVAGVGGLFGLGARHVQAGSGGHCGRRHEKRRLSCQKSDDQVSLQIPEGKPRSSGRSLGHFRFENAPGVERSEIPRKAGSAAVRLQPRTPASDVKPAGLNTGFLSADTSSHTMSRSGQPRRFLFCRKAVCASLPEKDRGYFLRPARRVSTADFFRRSHVSCRICSASSRPALRHGRCGHGGGPALAGPPDRPRLAGKGQSCYRRQPDRGFGHSASCPGRE